MVKIIIELFLIICFISLIIIDFRYKRLPNYINISLLISGFFLGIIEHNLKIRFIGAAVYTLPFIFLYGYGSDILRKECLGMGDIKLMISIGFLLKYMSLEKVLLFINISFSIALIYVLFNYLIKRKLLKEIAFGPFLIFTYFIFRIGEIYG